jgi:hypothetical protein
VETRLFTRDQYLGSFVPPMAILPDAVPAPCDIEPYVRAIDLKSIGVNNLGGISHIYVDGQQITHHVLVQTDLRDAFLVVIVGVKESAVIGHYLLDLLSEYGIESSSSK